MGYHDPLRSCCTLAGGASRFITIGRGVDIHTSDCPRLVSYAGTQIESSGWEEVSTPRRDLVVTVDRTELGEDQRRHRTLRRQLREGTAPEC